MISCDGERHGETTGFACSMYFQSKILQLSTRIIQSFIKRCSSAVTFL
jgi:hypothetical protein